MCCIVVSCVVLCCVVLYCIVLYCIVLYCIVLLRYKHFLSPSIRSKTSRMNLYYFAFSLLSLAHSY